ncbi:MAG: GTP cyclohydrolase FolE2 [Metallibacterium scheffleri]|jgi:GTP cyclohydrolase I|uniref:GTP cyclohydrolase FolE2 n=1 Tax=Metallibacterium scheffleri TaxID=993689 RepID=UPI0026ED2C17|nr:GTP cyclohydrolase FolE2 [Metallibacterium scheffleri]MCK9366342.1 GTP cyclohydrolase FolE2 [Metallibacterium scheffleri]
MSKTPAPEDFSMAFDTPAPRAMPDVACERDLEVSGRLERVGMQRIEALLRLPLADGSLRELPARIDAFVDLSDGEARGIHMSRLYRLIDAALATQAFTPALLHELLQDFLRSHEGLSSRAMLQVNLDLPLRRAALVSSHSGLRHYPLALSGSLERGGALWLELGVAITYASTCPCSAALARQLIAERFAEDFPAHAALDHAVIRAWLGSEQGIMATPHSQRSRADLRLRLAADVLHWPIESLIDRAEAALGTPVQTAVRREDEQAFARLNAANLMFCEDAARRLQHALDTAPDIADFWLRVAHFESLHPHDAVAVACKRVPGGYGGDDQPLT